MPSFREALDRLDDALGADLHAELGGTLRSFLYPAVAGPEAERRLMQTQVCQPAMAAVGLALHAVLRRMGAAPDVVLGHSLGEFAAAAAAGVVSDEDCLRLVARRGLAMVGLGLEDPGAMASAATDPATVRKALGGIDSAVVANLNHPGQTVVSGTGDAVRRASAALEEQGIKVTPLDVSHAFHSPLFAGVAGAVRELVAALPVRAPEVPVVSGITAAPYPADPAQIRRIWVEHATAPIDFVEALRRAAVLGGRVWLNVGAGTTLSAFAKATLPAEQRIAQLGLAGRDDDGLAGFAHAIGLLWALGVPLEPLALFDGRDAQLVTLPPTPIETQPYWAIERQPSSSEPLVFATPAPMQNGADMDPLVALFREQIALLQTHAKVLQQQAEALAQRGVSVLDFDGDPDFDLDLDSDLARDPGAPGALTCRRHLGDLAPDPRLRLPHQRLPGGGAQDLPDARGRARVRLADDRRAGRRHPEGLAGHRRTAADAGRPADHRAALDRPRRLGGGRSALGPRGAHAVRGPRRAGRRRAGAAAIHPGRHRGPTGRRRARRGSAPGAGAHHSRPARRRGSAGAPPRAAGPLGRHRRSRHCSRYRGRWPVH